jgi:enamine deaminase RidA (YjgF/YER057c/UK114 family)
MADPSTAGPNAAGRRSIDVPGFRHANPIPAASRIGPFVFSGVITGRDPSTGEMPASLADQCTNMFAHVRAIVGAAGGSTGDIARMTVWLADHRDREALNREWLTMFPDPADRPARQAHPGTFDGPALIQCDFIAVLAAG